MTETEGLSWVDLGPHACRLEPLTDTFYLRLRGDCTIETTRLFVEALRQFSVTRSMTFTLIDASGLGDLPGEVRGFMAESLKDIPIGATAIFGAGFAQRVIATLADKANNLVRRTGRFGSGLGQGGGSVEQGDRQGKGGEKSGRTHTERPKSHGSTPSGRGSVSVKIP